MVLKITSIFFCHENIGGEVVSPQAWVPLVVITFPTEWRHHTNFICLLNFQFDRVKKVLQSLFVTNFVFFVLLTAFAVKRREYISNRMHLL